MEKDKKQSYFERRIEQQAFNNIYKILNQIRDIIEKSGLVITKKEIINGLKNVNEGREFNLAIVYEVGQEIFERNKEKFISQETNKFFAQVENIAYMFRNTAPDSANISEDLPF